MLYYAISMAKQHHYYIECTFDENGKNWQRWSHQEKYLSFSKIKADVWNLCKEEQEYNQQNTFDSDLVPKIKGFRIVHETIEVWTETISEYLID